MDEDKIMKEMKYIRETEEMWYCINEANKG